MIISDMNSFAGWNSALRSNCLQT